MKIHTWALAALLLASCSDAEEEVFYTTSYPITKVEVKITAESEEYAAELGAEVLAAAPVKAGGAYILHFSRFDGGELQVTTEEGAATVAGSFTKVPGAKEITFIYGDKEYTAATSRYITDKATGATLLSIDLTEHYRTLYPDKGIKSVTRLEYTSHRE